MYLCYFLNSLRFTLVVLAIYSFVHSISAQVQEAVEAECSFPSSCAHHNDQPVFHNEPSVDVYFSATPRQQTPFQRQLTPSLFRNDSTRLAVTENPSVTSDVWDANLFSSALIASVVPKRVLRTKQRRIAYGYSRFAPYRSKHPLLERPIEDTVALEPLTSPENLPLTTKPFLHHTSALEASSADHFFPSNSNNALNDAAPTYEAPHDGGAKQQPPTTNFSEATCAAENQTCVVAPTSLQSSAPLTPKKPIWRRKGEELAASSSSLSHMQLPSFRYPNVLTRAPVEGDRITQDSSVSVIPQSLNDAMSQIEDTLTSASGHLGGVIQSTDAQHRKTQDVKYEEGTGVIPEALIETASANDNEDEKLSETNAVKPLTTDLGTAALLTDIYGPDEPLDPFATTVLGVGGKPFPAKGMYAYCYPFNEDQIVEKCSQAKDMDAVGVYVPLMMEVQIKHDPSWYAQIRRLKKASKLKIIGIAYEKPRWDLITEILSENGGLFDGIFLEWIGNEACVSSVPSPTVEQLQAIKETTRYGIIRYFVREQNFAVCDDTTPEFILRSEYIPLRKIQNITESYASLIKAVDGFNFPPYIQPVFGCMGGQEGLCYKAFKQHRETACSSHQRYIFNPYEYVGGRMLHMFNESCHGLPLLDLYGTL